MAGLMVCREILSNEFPPRVVPLIFSLNGWFVRGVMLAVKWTSLSFCRVTSRIRVPSVVMSSRRTELESIFSDPATVTTTLFDFPVRHLTVGNNVKKVDNNDTRYLIYLLSCFSKFLASTIAFLAF